MTNKLRNELIEVIDNAEWDMHTIEDSKAIADAILKRWRLIENEKELCMCAHTRDSHNADFYMCFSCPCPKFRPFSERDQ